MSEQIDTFIKKAGTKKWQKALTAATMFVRCDRRFIGMDKIRKPVAERAALQALGGDFPSPALARIAVSDPHLSRELDLLVNRAADVARKEVRE